MTPGLDDPAGLRRSGSAAACSTATARRCAAPTPTSRATCVGTRRARSTPARRRRSATASPPVTSVASVRARAGLQHPARRHAGRAHRHRDRGSTQPAAADLSGRRTARTSGPPSTCATSGPARPGCPGSAARPALVAIDAKTGGVLALVNYPRAASSTAIRGQYPPGSTFKIVTTDGGPAARASPSPARSNCPPKVFAGGRSFKNAEGRVLRPDQPPAGLRPLLQHRLRQPAHADDRRRHAEGRGRCYGFDGKQPLPIDSFGGTYPTGPGHDPYAEAFGQDQIEASPLQMAVGRRGHRGRHLAPAVRRRQRRPSRTRCRRTSSTQMRDMMRAVVTCGTAAPVYFPGEVSGKTGRPSTGRRPRAGPADPRLVRRVPRRRRLRGARPRRRFRRRGGRAGRGPLPPRARRGLTRSRVLASRCRRTHGSGPDRRTRLPHPPPLVKRTFAVSGSSGVQVCLINSGQLTRGAGFDDPPLVGDSERVRTSRLDLLLVVIEPRA